MPDGGAPSPRVAPAARHAARAHPLLFLGLLALLLAATGWAIAQAPLVRRAAHERAETLLRAALAREVRLREARLGLWTGVLELRGLQVGSPHLDRPLLTAESVRLRWSWLALLRRHLHLREVALVRADLTLRPERPLPAPSPSDRFWLPLRAPGLRTAGGWRVSVAAVSVAGGTIRSDGPHGGTWRVEELGGRLRWSSGSAPGASASLQAARLTLPLWMRQVRVARLRAEADWGEGGLAVREAVFELGGARVRLAGEVRDPLAAAILDLRADLEAIGPGGPSNAAGVLGVAGLRLGGRLHGPLAAARFSGEGRLSPGADGRAPALRLEAWREGGQIRAEAAQRTGGREPLRMQAAVAPDSGAFLLTVGATDADLLTLWAGPAALAVRAGLTLPARVRGRLHAALRVSGRGVDLAAIRGEGRLRVDELGVPGSEPTGRLEARARATAGRLTLDGFHLLLPAGDLRGRGTLHVAEGRFQVPLQVEVHDLAALGRSAGIGLLGGRGRLTGEVSGTATDPRLRGRLLWRDARIGPHVLDRVEGEVELASRTLRSPAMTLALGQTTAILRGSATALGKRPFRELRLGTELRLDLAADIPAGRTADLTHYVPEGLDIQGRFRAGIRLVGSPHALSGQVDLRMRDLRTWREPWERGRASVRLDRDSVAVRDIVVQRGTERVTGEVQVQAGGLRGRFESGGLELARVGWLAKVPLAGRTAARVELAGSTREPRIQGRAEASGLAFRGVPIGRVEADFTIVGKRTVQVQLSSEGRRLELAVDRPAETMRAELVAADADLDPLLRLAGVRTVGVAVRGSGRLALEGRVADPLAGQGELDFSRLRLTAAGDAWESRTPARARWRDKLVTLQPLRLGSGERELLVQGTIGEGQDTDLIVRGEISLPALAGFLTGVRASGGLAKADLRVRGSIGAPELRGEVAVHNGTVILLGLPAPIRDLEAVMVLEDRRTRIPSWQGRLADGEIRGVAELIGGEAPGFEVTFALDRARVDQVLGGLRGTGEVTGRLALTGTLRRSGRGEQDFWRALSGDLKAEMRDGHMGQHTILARILSLLNVTQLLNLRIPDLVSAGMPYDRLTATIALRDGVAHTEDLLLDAPAMKVNAVGAVSLADETVDLQVAVKPFQTVDTVLTKIPLAGWLLGGRERSLIVASFHVKGPLQEPEATALPLKDVQRNVFGVFRRILELPEALTGPFESLPSQPARPPEGGHR
jgi:autotransporter translocation and assembly factor TamB